MAFLEDLQNVKMETEKVNNDIVCEIVNYFKEEMASERFENELKSRIMGDIKNNRKETCLQVEFWEHHDGCSPTNFYVSGCERWCKGTYYNGVRLLDVSKDVVHELLIMFTKKLSDLGLTYRVENYGGRLGYPHWLVYIDLGNI